MNFYIQQSIIINNIKIGGISNSSVLQIGSAGIIRPSAYLYNTGNFSESAPQITEQEGESLLGSNAAADESTLLAPAVPLSSAVRPD